MIKATPIWARILPSLAGVSGFLVVGYRIIEANRLAIIALVVVALASQMFAEMMRGPKRAFSAATALLGGYAAVLVYMFVALPYNVNVPIEIGQISVLLLWLYLRPGPWPVVIICLYHAIAIANVAFMLTPLLSSNIVRTILAVHTLFRIVAIITMVLAFQRFRAAQQDQFRTSAIEVFE
jgi:hypothetical protein